jgi:hypothetical protein
LLRHIRPSSRNRARWPNARACNPSPWRRRYGARARSFRIQVSSAAMRGADALTPRRETRVDGAAVDLALDVEHCVDGLDRLDRERRKSRQLAARLGGDVGELEELASAVRQQLAP